MEHYMQLSKELNIQFTYDYDLLLLKFNWKKKSLQQQKCVFTEDPLSKYTLLVLIYVGLLQFRSFAQRFCSMI